MLISEEEATHRLSVLEREIASNEKLSKDHMKLLKNEADILRWMLED